MVLILVSQYYFIESSWRTSNFLIEKLVFPYSIWIQNPNDIICPIHIDSDAEAVMDKVFDYNIIFYCGLKRILYHINHLFVDNFIFITVQKRYFDFWRNLGEVHLRRRFITIVVIAIAFCIVVIELHKSIRRILCEMD